MEEDKCQQIRENLEALEKADFPAGCGCFQTKLFCDSLKTGLEISLIPHRDVD